MLKEEQTTKIKYYWAKFLFLAALYFVTGKLGLLMAVPPGYATAVWPPSGFALAGILIFGNRLWPAVWLGSFVVNIGTSLDTSSVLAMMRSATPVLVIGLGASLQALLGAILVRNVVGYPAKLENEKTVFKFLFFSGPVSCLVGCTVGITTLVSIGVIKLTSAMFSWWTWWVGDSIGVLIFAPIMMMFFAEPREIWQKRKVSILFPLAVTFTLIVAAFVFMKNTEELRIKGEFKHRSQVKLEMLNVHIHKYFETMFYIESFYKSSKSVERDEFKEFVRESLNRNRAFTALEWCALVKDADRSSFEESVRREGYPDFEIKEFDAAGQLKKASQRPEYVPVTYIEPFSEAHLKAFGFDFTSEKVRNKALQGARESGKVTLSGPIKLIQKPNSIGFVAFSPVTKNGGDGQVVGFLSEIFNIEDIVTDTFNGFQDKDFIIFISDIDPVQGETPFYASDFSQNKRISSVDEQKIAHESKGIVFSEVVELGSRHWKVSFYPKADFFIAQQSWNMWFLLAGGLFFIGLLGGFLLVISGRESMVYDLVLARTTELNNTNAQLKQLIAHGEDLAKSLHARNQEIDEARLAAMNIAQDAEEAKQLALDAKEALQVNETRLKLAMEGGKIGIWDWFDITKDEEWWSPEFYELLGYKNQEIKATLIAFRDMLHPEEQPWVFKTLNEHFKGQGKYDIEYRLKTKSGIYRWYHARGEAVRDRQGNPIRMTGTIVDITERKTQEEKILKFSQAVEHSSVSIVITDRKGDIEYVNPKFSSVTGYGFAEVIGKNPNVLKSGEQSKGFYKDLWDTISAGREWRGEFHNKKKNGELYWESASISGIKNAQGKLTHFVAVKEDITELKKTQQEIALLNSYQRTLLDSAGSSIISTDLDGVIRVFNHSAELMLGYRADEVIDKLTPAVIHDKDEVALRAEVFSRELGINIVPGFDVFVVRSRLNLSNTYEWTYIRKDGSRFPVLLSVSALRDDKENIFGYLGIASDISELKEAQIKAAELMNIKSEFISMVSHELRTPLTIIKESVAIVHDGTTGALNPDQKDFLGTAKNNIDRLARLINDVLDYQKLEANRMDFRMSKQSLNDVVDEVGRGFKVALENKGLLLKMQLQQELPAISFDKDKIIQVLTNLISNAMKFADKGSISLMTELVGENAIKVSVKDEGMGIKEDDFDKLFKTFSQISTGMGRETGGTGLGLALCKKIIEEHHGKINVASVYGQGATFYFILPIKERRTQILI